MRRDTFQAIADPTHRAILDMVAYQPLNINAIAGQFEVSRTAIYKHIKILVECGLVAIQQQGRERFCEAQLAHLSEVAMWMDQYKAFWKTKHDVPEEPENVKEKKAGKHKKKKSGKKK